MIFTENELRDFLFENYRENLSAIIIGKREPVVWDGGSFPPIHILLQQIAEKRINEIIDSLECLEITAKELRLKKGKDSITRVDLFGKSEIGGLTIIELKKSGQTERQSFTELLGYANHFCSLFPGLNENSITSVLVAPMENRIVRDSYVQELLLNKKKSVALIPKEKNGKVILEVYYPDKSYYQWFEDNLFDDRSMSTVAISFPIIEGWIDSDLGAEDRNIPAYSKEALNTISNTISHKLESLGYHSLVYSSQKWCELAQIFPYPNQVFVVAVNPFASFRTSIHDDEIYGESEDGRIDNVQYIFDQLCDDDKEFWIECIECSFSDNLTDIVKDEFKLCLLNNECQEIKTEFSFPHWHGIKSLPTESGTSHNLDVFLTGLIREIYLEYVRHVYGVKGDLINFGENLPKYSYQMLCDYLPIWEILGRIGLFNDSDNGSI